MIHEVFMPALSSTMTEGKIVSWIKSPGDQVEKGETVLVVESDKADMDVESFYAGYLAVIAVPAGEMAPVGSTIGYVAETEADIALAQEKAKSSSTAAEAPAVPDAVPPTPVAASLNGGNTSATQSTGRTIVSPRARKLAKQFQVDLKSLAGSGPHGRIVAADVEKASGQVSSTSVAVATPPVITATQQSTPVPAAALAGEIAPFNTMQQAVVTNMMASLAVPTFHVGYTITTDALDALYKQLKVKGVTMTGLLAKAIAVTLKQHPLVNASYSDQGIQYRAPINVAVAVAMPGGGLITPVLQHADQLDIYSLSRDWKDLVSRARSKQLQPNEYSSGTFTLSNLGMFGVDSFDAILPPGQGSILAVGASRSQTVATEDGLFGVKRQMRVNITCDHRIIYGADAAAFLRDLAQLIEVNPQSLTM
ncbi:Dihydrolipoyllysine-residue acetyltransferase component of pyruvate dehydrogenase complex [Acaryochloris thomasi RCC1774]|uniref:Dihydrolipoamide acetyltransferase component of pyruvate dehydrogenase complex n=1 Tax=Acaryochloris thomasi RCC1774 TaxID=1764569 RepID=A0A2W1K236_9CYAN|nr:dihydrolipoamide acetyltransferase family protein [Acaryochloris thomasi]PZD74167.1 Dihydrolipoyllysine-residue acetyltransferase component of pyruvate dehydrogenase complex [Acaryochloris thomasi RCC1774]